MDLDSYFRKKLGKKIKRTVVGRRGTYGQNTIQYTAEIVEVSQGGVSVHVRSRDHFNPPDGIKSRYKNRGTYYVPTIHDLDEWWVHLTTRVDPELKPHTF